jgi:acyl-CoA reductase-like NAD-dependent aldehyde dehydrogenase
VTAQLVASIVDGRAIEEGARYTLHSPVDGAAFAQAVAAAPAVADQAGAAARAAYHAARRTTAEQRRQLCHRVADELIARQDTIARTVTVETGRPVSSTRDEVAKAAAGFRLAGEEATRLRGDSVPVAAAGKLTLTRWRPTGVWAVATPWNFPVNIPVEYLGPLLATGNAAVWKPAPTTVRSAALVMSALSAAGVPDGLVNLLVTDQTATAERLISHPDVVGVGLTGSTATGKAVARAAAGKRLILELGGNGPVVVFADADLPAAAAAVATSCFAASGQICSAGGRILADARIAHELAEAIAAEAKHYPVGNPFEPGTAIGPMHLARLVDRVEQQVAAAVAAGARLLVGGRHLDGFPTAQYLPATVLDGVGVDAALNAEETFGPVAPVVPLPESELVAEANRRTHALSAAVFTRDLGRAITLLDELAFGTVVVNDRSTYWELHLPFGGWEGKGSGTGRVGVPEVVRQVCQLQTVSLAG